MQNFVSYIRVSTQKQGSSGLGLEAQRSAIENYTNTRGTIVKEFQEVESGKKGFKGRPQLQEAINYCKKNKMPLVIGKIDRLGRDVKFFLDVIDNSKVKICFADFPDIDPNQPSGRMILTSMANFAEFEAGMISQRTKDALRSAKDRGVKLGAKGAENIKGVNDDRAQKALQFAEKLRPTITALHAQGLSLRKIASALNESGSRTENGKEWQATQVSNVIKRLGLK